MKETLEKLWNECFAEECAMLDTEEEKESIRKVADLQKKASELLTKEQRYAVEKYIEALYESQSFYVKKAFFKGCKFATSFLIESVVK